jgi:flavin-dependent dehydrogenase
MHDVIVIGGGPAGSTAATILAQRGRSALLLERERFPRFQIGESMLPYSNDIFRRLGVYEKLVDGDFFPKYGGAFVTADGSASTVFRFNENLEPPYKRSFHVERSRFDQLLLDHSRENGVEVREETPVSRVDLADGSRVIVETAAGEKLESRFVIDASGHGALLAHATGRRTAVSALKKIAFFSHYRNVEHEPGRDKYNIVIVVLRNAWFWMIPLSEEKMSVGLVIERDHAMASGLSPEETLDRTIALAPYVARRMRNAERTAKVFTRKDFSYRVSQLVGENFALVGDAAGFLDPIFSTGVMIAMTSATRVADAVVDKLERGSMRALRSYESKTQTAINRYLRFIQNFYRREFLEMLLHPDPPRRMFLAIVRVLGGNVFSSRLDRMMLGMFFTMVRLQKRFRFAPPIAWDSLPSAASV